MENPGPLVGNARDINSLLIYPVCSLAQLWGYKGLRRGRQRRMGFALQGDDFKIYDVGRERKKGIIFLRTYYEPSSVLIHFLFNPQNNLLR